MRHINYFYLLTNFIIRRGAVLCRVSKIPFLNDTLQRGGLGWFFIILDHHLFV